MVEGREASHGGSKGGEPWRTYFRVFCTKRPATTAMVVGRDAAHTPSLFNVFSSIPDATTNGGAHCWVVGGKEKDMNEWGGEGEWGGGAERERYSGATDSIQKARRYSTKTYWCGGLSFVNH